MNEPLKWIRVTRGDPCTICEKPDWCTYSPEAAIACCMRVESQKLMSNGGWKHLIGDRPERPVFHEYPRQPALPTPDFNGIMRRWWDATPPGRLDQIAAGFNVSSRSLQWLRTAWSEERQCIAFPMYDGTCWNGDNPIGVRLRSAEGKKFAVTGSRSGVFIPYGTLTEISCRRVFVCEGPTDTAACLDMGLFAFGRASCRGGEHLMVNCISQLDPKEVIVISDNDGPGVEGADVLMDQLDFRKAKLIPPSKDLRRFVSDGGTAGMINDMLKNVMWS